ncbi:hypothetical protein QYF36_024379 [Acer negundo]|nr:hypothetical protein QYF36_024379 [Acer negundo]
MVTDHYLTTNVHGNGGYGKTEEDYIKRHNKQEVRDHQCSSSLVKHFRAPVPLVWLLVRSFDQPQKYKTISHFTERLEQLDDEEHIFSMRIVGGDHRLKNYSSIVTVHPEVIEGRPGTMVIESFWWMCQTEIPRMKHAILSRHLSSATSSHYLMSRSVWVCRT